MLTYEQAKAKAIAETVPDGKAYLSRDGGDIFIFIIVGKDTPTNIPGFVTGRTFTAVSKENGKVFSIDITDKRMTNSKTIEGPTKKEPSFKVRR